MKFRNHNEPYEFDALATYNSEVARGIVHTPEWKAQMAHEQERFNQRQRQWALDNGHISHNAANRAWRKRKRLSAIGDRST